MTPQEAYAFAQPGFRAYSEHRFADAESVADQILMLSPDDPNGLYLKGICRKAAADALGALPFLQRAAKAVPGQLGFEMAIGQCLTDMRAYAEARTVFSTLETRFPQSAELLVEHARLEQADGDLAAARALYERALTLKPGEKALLRSLAWVCEHQRDWEGVDQYAEAVLKDAPGDPLALSAAAARELAEGRFVVARDRIDVNFQPEKNTASENLPVYRHLGAACEGMGDFDGAFKAFETGNESLRADLANTNAFRDEIHSLTSVSRIADAFEQREPELVLPEPVGPAPAFILGFPRSGTTLLEQIVNAHSRTLTTDESALLQPILEYAGDTTESLDAFSRSLPEKSKELIAGYWERARMVGDPTDRVLVDKLPLNTIWIGVIAQLFPNARILLALRDPRDCVFSAFKQRFSLNTAMINFLNLDNSARYYDAVMRAGTAAMKAFPYLTITQIRYEDMVADTEGQARRAVEEGLGLDWEEGVMDYRNRLTSGISTPSVSQVERPIYDGSVGLWRKYKKHMQHAAPILDPWVEHWGYADQD